MKRQPHSLLMKSIRQALRLCGWFVVPIKAGFGSYPGIADLYALREGRHVWLEIKTGKQRLTDDQSRFAQDIRSRCGEIYLVKSIEDLKKAGMVENILL
jgi:hypothetical protein